MKMQGSGMCLTWDILAGAIALAVFIISPAMAADSPDEVREWMERIANRYEMAAARADARLARADSSVTGCRDIFARARASRNVKVQDRATKALAEAEALRKKALAEKTAARAAVTALRKRMAGKARMQWPGLVVDSLSGENGAGGVLRPLSPGDLIVTGPDGGADLHLLEVGGIESHVRVGASSRLKAREGAGETAPMGLVLENGEVYVTDSAVGPEAEAEREERKSKLDSFLACVEKAGYGKCTEGFLRSYVRRFEVRTPAAVLAVRGTAYVLRHNESTDETTLVVLEGEVAFLSDRHGKALLVKSGRAARANETGLALAGDPVDVEAEKLRWEEGP